jgi:hypothetical protein
MSLKSVIPELCYLVKKHAFDIPTTLNIIGNDKKISNRLNERENERIILFSEASAVLCKLPNGKMVVNGIDEPSKYYPSIDRSKNLIDECLEMDGEPIGGFHTHPLGDGVPAINDLNVGSSMSVFCIGYKDEARKNHVRCFEPLKKRYFTEDHYGNEYNYLFIPKESKNKIELDVSGWGLYEVPIYSIEEQKQRDRIAMYVLSKDFKITNFGCDE